MGWRIPLLVEFLPVEGRPRDVPEQPDLTYAQRLEIMSTKARQRRSEGCDLAGTFAHLIRRTASVSMILRLIESVSCSCSHLADHAVPGDIAQSGGRKFNT